MYASHLRLRIVRPTLRAMGMWSHAFEDLLMGTAAVETHLGDYAGSMATANMFGIYRISVQRAEEVVLHYLPGKPSLEAQFWDGCAAFPGGMPLIQTMTPERIIYKLCSDMGFQTAVARIMYGMGPVAMPDELMAPADYVEALARIWLDKYGHEDISRTIQRFTSNYWMTTVI